MENERFYLVCFASSQRAIAMEKEVKPLLSAARIVPVPPEIRATCGLGIRIAKEEFPIVSERFAEDEVYIVEKSGNQRTVRRA